MLIAKRYCTIPMLLLSGIIQNPVGGRLKPSATDDYSCSVLHYACDRPVGNHAKTLSGTIKNHLQPMIVAAGYCKIPVLIQPGTVQHPVGNLLEPSNTVEYRCGLLHYSYDHPVRNHAKPRLGTS